MEPDVVKILAQLSQLGVGGSIAGLLFYFYRKDVRAYTELWQAQAKLNHEQTQAMMVLVSSNTAALTSNTEVLKSLHRRIDRLDILRLTPDDDAGDAKGRTTG